MPGNHLRIQTDEKRRILIVDDEMINREILRAALSEDYEVIIAENGRDAFTQIQNSEREISLILLDLLMPVMSGMEVLKRLRESRDWSKIPVIVMTADHKSEVECLELGATDFISKPIHQETSSWPGHAVSSNCLKTEKSFTLRREIR